MNKWSSQTESETTTSVGDGVLPEGGLGGRGGGLTRGPLGLRPPIPIAFYDPHQLHSYPCLYAHLPSSRRVVARSGRPGSARGGSVSCRVLSRALRSIANRSRAHSHLR